MGGLRVVSVVLNLIKSSEIILATSRPPIETKIEILNRNIRVFRELRKVNENLDRNCRAVETIV